MMLILGDWARSLWFVVFAVVSFRRGTIETHTRICQAAGYLIQMGTEISGQTALFLSVFEYRLNHYRLRCPVHINPRSHADLQAARLGCWE